ncbi:DUF6316 family protein [Pleionea sediminis]|uniref:DUF6316 family protein n=1 Tax=Pleionea sediminis TaxID=2569479 RepID=UPI001185A232|nr:DUF6316 family protein [Pleionea sediminis]
MRSTDLENKKYIRSSRYVMEGSFWYFKTREGDYLGPYPSVREVFEAERKYIELVTHSLRSSFAKSQ